MSKKILNLIFVIALISCNTKTAITEKITSTRNCPADGICTFEILENQELQLMKDEFGNTFHQLNNIEGKVILKFEYKKNQDPQLADDEYTEIIFVQIDKSTNLLELKDESLSDAKVSFARICYCRGATGIYPVERGQLKLTKLEKQFNLKLAFQIDEVPQIINSIDETFKI
jgi:hypothetical protein